MQISFRARTSSARIHFTYCQERNYSLIHFFTSRKPSPRSSKAKVKSIVCLCACSPLMASIAYPSLARSFTVSDASILPKISWNAHRSSRKSHIYTNQNCEVWGTMIIISITEHSSTSIQTYVEHLFRRMVTSQCFAR